jgi:hypothetical protein
MGGDPRASGAWGGCPFMPQVLLSSRHARASRAPALDPGARIVRSDGDNQRLLVVAVELFAVAPSILLA